MSVDLLGWTTRSNRPAAPEVLASLRATVTGKPWKRAGGRAPAGVDVFLTAREIVISSPSSLHMTASLHDVTEVVKVWGSVTIRAAGGTVNLEAPRAELAPFVAELEARRDAQRLARPSTEQFFPQHQPAGLDTGTFDPSDVPGWDHPGADPGFLAKRSWSRRLLETFLVGILIVIVVLVGETLIFDDPEVALVEDVLATLAAGDPIPTEMVCSDPDDVVSRLVDDPQAWPVDSYQVLDISDLSYEWDVPLSLWYVECDRQR